VEIGRCIFWRRCARAKEVFGIAILDRQKLFTQPSRDDVVDVRSVPTERLVFPSWGLLVQASNLQALLFTT
jgi:hypothetical protein